MSEEEIIGVLKNHAQYTNTKVINANTKKEYKVSEALQGLLDLYNKEKATSHYIQSQLDILNAKLIELENADLTTVYINGFYDGEKKWKDKIKAKIKQYEGLKEMDMSAYEETINPLQDLLEEDNK